MKAPLPDRGIFAACHTLAASLLVISISQLSLPFGSQGHRAIGDVASSRLTPTARAAVIAILGDDRLDLASTWADELKELSRNRGPLTGNAEALKFNIEHPDNANWHFVNLPLGSPGYDSSQRFAARNDIVQMINRCIVVLEDSSSNREMTKAQALRVLVHLVGDIHQPLHVGTGFYQIAADGRVRLVTSPAGAFGLPNDRGGNDLFLPSGENWHSYWDTTLVAKLAGSRDASELSRFINARLHDHTWLKSHQDRLNPLTRDHHRWAAQWATISTASQSCLRWTAVRSGSRNNRKRPSGHSTNPGNAFQFVRTRPNGQGCDATRFRRLSPGSTLKQHPLEIDLPDPHFLIRILSAKICGQFLRCSASKLLFFRQNYGRCVTTQPRFFSGLGVKPLRSGAGAEEKTFCEFRNFDFSSLTFLTASLTLFFSALFMIELYIRSFGIDNTNFSNLPR